MRDLKDVAVGNVQTWGPQDLDEEDLEASFERYCQDVQETAAWGGQTELNALANVLQHHIKVYAARLPVVDMGQQYAGDHHALQSEQTVDSILWQLWYACFWE